MRNRWILELQAALDALLGEVVTEAWVDEMALYGQDDASQFTDRNLRFVQANLLELRTSHGRLFRFSCAQIEDAWELWPRIATAEKRLSIEMAEEISGQGPCLNFQPARLWQ